MATPSDPQMFGNFTNFLAVSGAVAVSYVCLRLCFSILKAIRTYILARILRLSTNLQKLGEWAVVTGATDGIGKAYAQQLARQGLNIVLISRTESKLKDVAGSIEHDYKVKTKIIVADFTQGTSIYDGIRNSLGGLQIGVLVNNVGLSYSFPEYFLEVVDREKVFADLLHVNCTSMTMMTSIVLPAMVERKKGAVINISSAAGLHPTPLLSVYSATKAYVSYLTDCLAYEYNPKGITVQCVSPYFVATNMSKVRRPNLWIPSPSKYVSSALKAVGIETITTGYWLHALTDWLSKRLPCGLFRTIEQMTMKATRKRGRRKLESKKTN